MRLSSNAAAWERGKNASLESPRRCAVGAGSRWIGFRSVGWRREEGTETNSRAAKWWRCGLGWVDGEPEYLDSACESV